MIVKMEMNWIALKRKVPSEDQMYLEKIRQLSRFIEPLTRLIGRYGDDDSEKLNLSKMKLMLDHLKNPNKRMPMDTLLKCEAVLEKMDFKRVSLSCTFHSPCNR